MNVPGELTCQELVELVTAYLDDALAAAERERFERHLVYCRGCSAYLEQVRAQLRATQKLREDSLEPRMRDELLRAFRGWKKGGS